MKKSAPRPPRLNCSPPQHGSSVRSSLRPASRHSTSHARPAVVEFERRGPALLHFCVECGAWGAFGYSVTGGSLGRWYCRDHRPGSAP